MAAPVTLPCPTAPESQTCRWHARGSDTVLCGGESGKRIGASPFGMALTSLKGLSFFVESNQQCITLAHNPEE